MEQSVLLRMTDITKTFPGVRALDQVSLDVKAGTVHALMGENGAGKSTLMKCLFGIYSKDIFTWRAAKSTSPAARRRSRTASPWCTRN